VCLKLDNYIKKKRGNFKYQITRPIEKKKELNRYLLKNLLKKIVTNFHKTRTKISNRKTQFGCQKLIGLRDMSGSTFFSIISRRHWVARFPILISVGKQK